MEEEVEEDIRPTGSQTGSQMGSQIGEDFDIDDVDWGDANKEIDDALNETDDDEGESVDGYLSDSSIISDRSDGSIRKGKKRERESGDEGDGFTSNGTRIIAGSTLKGKSTSASSSSNLNVGSPLQKRVKTAISRKSRLKNSYPAEGEEISSPAQALVQEELVGSQASSSLDSDDDAFFSSMADELESGWQ